MSESPWRQVTITFPDWAGAEDTAVVDLAPLLTAAETAGLITAWFFVRKQPAWRVRYRPADTTPAAHDHLHARLDALQQKRRITRVAETVYEPETHAFGGPEAMASAHRLWHLDSRHLLAYLTDTQPEPATRRRREMSILLASTMLRAGRLDWYEQGDVWAGVADHREPPEHPRADERRTLQANVRRLMSVETSTLTATGTPVLGASAWTAAYQAAGRELADLNDNGHLSRGLRDVLAHQVIFASNRLGVPAAVQAVLADAARTAVFGDAPPATEGPAPSATRRRR